MFSFISYVILGISYTYIRNQLEKSNSLLGLGFSGAELLLCFILWPLWLVLNIFTKIVLFFVE